MNLVLFIHFLIKIITSNAKFGNILVIVLIGLSLPKIHLGSA